MSSAIVHQASRMNIKSTPERITLFKLALDVNRHERDELMNELMHTYIMDTLESDAMLISSDNDVMSRVTHVFD
jgi:hypothetical protein